MATLRFRIINDGTSDIGADMNTIFDRLTQFDDFTISPRVIRMTDATDGVLRYTGRNIEGSPPDAGFVTGMTLSVGGDLWAEATGLSVGAKGLMQVQLNGSGFDIGRKLFNGDDRIVGTSLTDNLFGLGGDDTMLGGAGADFMIGYQGGDRMDGGRGNDFLLGDSQVSANEGTNDVLIGGAGNDTLVGDPGRDTLFGGSGKDFLSGSQGRDSLTGGRGADLFEFAALSSSRTADRIADFRPGQDTLVLNAMEFTAIDTGDLDPTFFRRGTRAEDGDDHFIWNRRAGTLIFDANADDPGGTTVIARLDEGLQLRASDILLGLMT